MEKFRQLGLSEDLLKALKDEKIEEPTEIQLKSIPVAVAGKDVIGASATGSGKTLAFASTILRSCQSGHGIQALILTPTRELAVQVTQALKTFSKYKKLNITDIYGGVSIEPQMQRLRTADVVVATPGRLIDHMERRTVDMRRIKILVIDEADRMFDMGFIKDVKIIIRACPEKRQTLLFSATITKDVWHLANKFMKDPKKVSAEEYVDPTKLKQAYYDVDENLKISLLAYLLKQPHPGLAMIFCNTKSTVNLVTTNLRNQGILAHSIHGGHAQGKRSSTMEKFHTEEIKILVCTDVAARGLDIKGVSHVYNYDVPIESKQYVHRIGRTARAGKNGKAIILLSRKQHFDFKRLLSAYRGVEIRKEETPKNLPNIRIVLPPRNRRPVRGSGSFRRRF